MLSSWTSLCLLPMLSIAACDDGRSQLPSDVVTISQTTLINVALPTIYEGDRIVSVRHPREAAAMAAVGGAIDANGLIGRNRRYGRLISPRFQVGAGAALRTGLHLDEGLAARGFRAIEAGMQAVGADGTVHSLPPPDAPAGAILSRSDLASGAAFFMADACPALLALENHADADAVAAPSRRIAAIDAIKRALGWLIAHANHLERADRAAPNRLLHDALAFSSCGALSKNPAAQKLAARFAELALSQTRSDGVFVEKGGSDTSYQAVSVRLAADLLMTGYTAADAGDLKRAWYAGAIWLGNRILADGRIDSRGNTRTCDGGEAFLGTPKKVSPAGVYGALVYAGELASNNELNIAAARLAVRAQVNPREDPCLS